MSTRIQLRRDLAAAWTSVNPVLAAGEPAMEKDTGKLKIGDGSSVWSALPYFLDLLDLTPEVQALVEEAVADALGALPPGLTDENVRDIVGAALVNDGDLIEVVVDDVNNVIRVVPSAALTASLDSVPGKQDASTLSADVAAHTVDGSELDVALRANFVAHVAAPTGVAATDQAAIQDAIDAANTAGGGTVILQAGRYAMNAELILRDSVHVRGHGRNATTLAWSTDLGAGKYAVKGQVGAISQVYAPYISDLKIAGPGEATYTIGVAPCSMDGWRVGRNSDAADVAVYGFRTGLVLPGDHNTFTRCKVSNNYYAALWPSDWETKSNHAFYSCDMSGNTFATLAIEGDNTIDGCVFIGGHGGVSPYVIYKFDGPNGPSTAPAIHSTIFELFAMESTGNAAILDESTGANQFTLVGVTINTPGHSWDATRKIADRDADYGAKVRGITRSRVTGGDYPITAGAVAAWNITPPYNPVGLTLVQDDAPVVTGVVAGVQLETMDLTATYLYATAAITAGQLVGTGQNGGCQPYGQDGDRAFAGVALQSVSANTPVAVAISGRRIPVNFGAGGALTGGIPVVPDPADLTRVIMAPGGGSTGYWNGRTATVPSPHGIVGYTYLDCAANSTGFIALAPKADRTYVAPHAVSALPTASATYRGQMLRVEGGAGVADVLYVCTKNASDVYGWRAVTVT